jgi:hypothetical protein
LGYLSLAHQTSEDGLAVHCSKRNWLNGTVIISTVIAGCGRSLVNRARRLRLQVIDCDLLTPLEGTAFFPHWDSQDICLEIRTGRPLWLHVCAGSPCIRNFKSFSRAMAIGSQRSFRILDPRRQIEAHITRSRQSWSHVIGPVEAVLFR